MTKLLLPLSLIALVLGGCASNMKCRDEAGEEKPEIRVAFDQLPTAVKSTFAAEAAGATAKDAEKEMKHGKVVYELDAMIGTKNYEIKIAEDGQLLSKKLDNEAEEKEEKGDKNKEYKGEKHQNGGHED